MRNSLHTPKVFFTALFAAFSSFTFAQSLPEVTGIQFYEHHSSAVTGMPFGEAAEGSKSGYDFVGRKYIWSFDEMTGTAYTNGEEANIDMVEHNGPFGSNGASMYLGFTSGVSTIWGGSIQGNGTTKWMKAPSNFDYAGATMSSILSAYNDASATVAVDEVKNDEMYIGKIRGGSLYVVIRCYNVDIPSGPPSGQNDNVSFQFDYKYGGSATGLAEAENKQISVFPNPSANTLAVKLNNNEQVQSVKICSSIGQVVLQTESTSEQIDISTLPAGMYLVNVTTTNGNTLIRQIIKQ